MSSSIVLIISSVGLLAFGIYKIWKVIELSRRISASKTWPVMMGEVVSKKVSERHNRKSGTSYYPKVKYRYSVMGQPYEKEITLTGIFSRNSAEEALAKIGETIEVRYNPNDPKENITGKEKVNITDILLIIVCLGLFIFTMATFLM